MISLAVDSLIPTFLADLAIDSDSSKTSLAN
jgi:hypothetical protein